MTTPYTQQGNYSLCSDWKKQAKNYKSWTDWGHCPFCLTDQDMLENQSCCTECGEPLEEGRVDDAD